MINVIDARFVIGVTAAFVSGACFGSAAAIAFLERDYDKRLGTELAKTKDYYARMTKTKDYYARMTKTGKYESPKEAVQELIPEGEKPVVKKFVEYAGKPSPDSQRGVSIQNIFTTPIPDAEPKPKPSKAGGPFVISQDEFYENDPDHTQSSFTYFEEDDVLLDDRDKPVDVLETIGSEALQFFGYESKDKNVVHVRNPNMYADYEVTYNPGKYSELVLGFVEHSDQQGIRRFRGDD